MEYNNLENYSISELICLLNSKAWHGARRAYLKERDSYVLIEPIQLGPITHGNKNTDKSLKVYFKYISPRYINRVWDTEPFILELKRDVLFYCENDILLNPTTERLQWMKKKIIEEIKYIDNPANLINPK